MYGGFGVLKAIFGRAFTVTGGFAGYIPVWFFIALWTFADPGFHQRCYAAKDGGIARKGIIISIVLWFFFDFLTTTTGLYARAALPNLTTPSQSYLILAEKLLAPGVKGFFYIALLATVLSTLNSFLFISATTLGRDFFYKLAGKKEDFLIKRYTNIGLLISAITSVALAYLLPS